MIDFHGLDLYGWMVTVEFSRRLRPMAVFRRSEANRLDGP